MGPLDFSGGEGNVSAAYKHEYLYLQNAGSRINM